MGKKFKYLVTLIILFGSSFAYAQQVDSVIIKKYQAIKKEQKDMKPATAEEGIAFLESNAKKPGVVSLPSGLQYKVIREGKGQRPDSADRVVVNYTGYLVNGKIVDSSSKRGKPAEISFNGIIRGWKEALLLMPAGSKWELYVPSGLAYGTHTGQGTFPPNSVLIFEIELLDVVK